MHSMMVARLWNLRSCTKECFDYNVQVNIKQEYVHRKYLDGLWPLNILLLDSQAQDDHTGNFAPYRTRLATE